MKFHPICLAFFTLSATTAFPSWSEAGGNKRRVPPQKNETGPAKQKKPSFQRVTQPRQFDQPRSHQQGGRGVPVRAAPTDASRGFRSDVDQAAYNYSGYGVGAANARVIRGFFLPAAPDPLGQRPTARRGLKRSREVPQDLNISGQPTGRRRALKKDEQGQSSGEPTNLNTGQFSVHDGSDATALTVDDRAWANVAPPTAFGLPLTARQLIDGCVGLRELDLPRVPGRLPSPPAPGTLRHIHSQSDSHSDREGNSSDGPLEF